MVSWEQFTQSVQEAEKLARPEDFDYPGAPVKSLLSAAPLHARFSRGLRVPSRSGRAEDLGRDRSA